MEIDNDRLAELARIVAWLKRTEAYTGATAQVEAIETHLSWVFLTDTRAYKLKKPVRTEHLDYSTAERRRLRCDDEVRLNRRLARDVYLGASPLLREGDAFKLSPNVLQPGCELSAEGEVADWLVVMRRLPRERTLEHLIKSGSSDPEAVRAAALVLAQFYEEADRVTWSGEEYRLRLERDVLRYRRELDAPRFPVMESSLDEITGWQLDRLRREPELFDARAHARRIVDGHGDLRPEHIFLLKPEPVVIDCLEFDRELRLLDAASELSFLALECRRLSVPDLGREILDVYMRATGDVVPGQLIDFYESHHACIRAAVALWHLDDPTADSRSKWVNKARTYLGLAAQLSRGSSSMQRAGSQL